jgi:hypothetical protein
MKFHIDSWVDSPITNTRELLDIGVPMTRIGAGEIITAPWERLHASTSRARVGAGEADFDIVYAKASAVQKGEKVRPGAADEMRISGGLAGVPFEHHGQLRGG